MVDATTTFVNWVGAGSGIGGVPATRIVGGDLPDGAKPGAGEEWITLRCRGGESYPEIPDWIKPSFEVACWAADPVTARQIYLAFREIVHGALGVTVSVAGYDDAFIAVALEEVQGQDVTDPETGWALVISYYQLTMRTA